MFLLQPNEVAGQSGGVNRFWNESGVYAQTHRQTDGKVIPIAQRLLLKSF